jgi:hypothetical protein
MFRFSLKTAASLPWRRKADRTVSRSTHVSVIRVTETHPFDGSLHMTSSWICQAWSANFLCVVSRQMIGKTLLLTRLLHPVASEQLRYSQQLIVDPCYQLPVNKLRYFPATGRRSMLSKAWWTVCTMKKEKNNTTVSRLPPLLTVKRILPTDVDIACFWFWTVQLYYIIWR